MKGDLSPLAPELNAIEGLKKRWKYRHAQCYRKGLRLLTMPQMAEWLPIENLMRPLPDTGNLQLE